MTNAHAATILRVLRRIDERVQRVEERLQWEFPTTTELRDQLETELHSILAGTSELKAPGTS
jgi:hypothetical protein